MESVIKYFISYHYKTIEKEGFGNEVIIANKPIKGMDNIRMIQDRIEDNLVKKFELKVDVTVLNIVKL